MTLLEAAKRADEDMCEFGIQDKDLEAAIAHESDERRDIEQVLAIVSSKNWYSDLLDEEMREIVDRIMWRRKAVAQKAG